MTDSTIICGVLDMLIKCGITIARSSLDQQLYIYLMNTLRKGK